MNLNNKAITYQKYIGVNNTDGGQHKAIVEDTILETEIAGYSIASVTRYLITNEHGFAAIIQPKQVLEIHK